MLGRKGDRGFAIVDADRFAELQNYAWSLKHNGYVFRTFGTCRNGKTLHTVYMHHAIMGGRVDGLDVDHRNGVKHDNRKSNLRHATRSQNLHNMRKRSGTSRYIGVRWRKDCKRWSAQLWCNSKPVFMKCFASELEAAIARDEAAKLYHGEFAKLNFP